MAQHDYVIDNSTGANVRADINSALQAIVTNNSGSSAPSTTYALQSFANTTDSMLQLRNSANNAFVNLRKFDGTLPLPDGSASSPSLFFDDDTNTGIFSGSADEFNIATGGTERFVINSSGNCGIGTLSPVRDLEVKGASGDPVHFKLEGDPSDYARIMFADGTDDNIGEIRYNFGSDFMSFNANAAERMRIDSSGDVLIGTTTAVVDTKLVVAGNINQFNPDTGTQASTKSYVLGRSYTMSTSSTNILTFDNWGTSAFDITVFRRDNAHPGGAAVHKVYLAFKGSGTNMTQAAIAQEHKVAISGIHGITFSVSENNDTATLIVTGDDNEGETQDLTFHIMARGNGNGTIVVV